MLLGAPEFVVFLVFLLVTSVAPLVLDVAEELYAGEVARQDAGSVLRFNNVLYSLIGLVGQLLARPLGAVLASTGVVIALSISVVVSAIAIVFRILGTRRLHSAERLDGVVVAPVDDESSPSPDAEQNEDLNDSPALEDRRESRIAWHHAILERTPGGPLLSTLSALSTAIVGTYLGIWAVRGTAEPSAWLGLILVAGGIGATVGPSLASHIRRRSAPRFVRGLFATRALLLVVVAVTAAVMLTGIARIVTVAVALLMLSALTVATVRQLQYGGAGLAQAVGWGHSGSAAGSFIGTWLGIGLQVAVSPILGLAIGATVAAVGAVVVRMRHVLSP